MAQQTRTTLPPAAPARPLVRTRGRGVVGGAAALALLLAALLVLDTSRANPSAAVPGPPAVEAMPAGSPPAHLPPLAAPAPADVPAPAGAEGEAGAGDLAGAAHLAWQRECEASAALFAAYGNGQVPASRLQALSWSPDDRLHPGAAAALERLEVAFRARFGVPLQVTSSYRSLESQVRAREELGTLAADPGTSNHGWGIAVDLGGGIQQLGTPEHRWMRDNAPALGWVQPAWAAQHGGLPEPWHWEFHGTPAPGAAAPARPANLQDPSGPVEITPAAARSFCR